jgi:hypothetical protein
MQSTRLTSTTASFLTECTINSSVIFFWGMSVDWKTPKQLLRLGFFEGHLSEAKTDFGDDSSPPDHLVHENVAIFFASTKPVDDDDNNNNNKRTNLSHDKSHHGIFESSPNTSSKVRLIQIHSLSSFRLFLSSIVAGSNRDNDVVSVRGLPSFVSLLALAYLAFSFC